MRSTCGEDVRSCPLQGTECRGSGFSKPGRASDECSPAQHLDGNLRTDREPELPSRCNSNFLAQETEVILLSC